MPGRVSSMRRSRFVRRLGKVTFTLGVTSVCFAGMAAEPDGKPATTGPAPIRLVQGDKKAPDKGQPDKQPTMPEQDIPTVPMTPLTQPTAPDIGIPTVPATPFGGGAGASPASTTPVADAP